MFPFAPDWAIMVIGPYGSSALSTAFVTASLKSESRMGELRLVEEAGQKLTLTNFYANAGSAADVGDWNAATTEVSFTKPIAIKYVAHFNADDSKDTVNVYLNGAKVATKVCNS